MSFPVDFELFKYEIKQKINEINDLNDSKNRKKFLIYFYSLIESISVNNLLDFFENLTYFLTKGTLKLNYLLLKAVAETVNDQVLKIFSSCLKTLQIRGLIEEYPVLIKNNVTSYGYQITSSGQEFLNRIALEKAIFKQN